MKEATGELDMTLVVAIIVGLLASFFYFSIWPKIGESQNTDCARAVCKKETLNKDGFVRCKVKNQDGTEENDVLCKYKG